MDYVADRRAAWGPEWSGPVALTAKEYDGLKTELGSTGGAQIVTVEGVKILVGSMSDLPPLAKGSDLLPFGGQNFTAGKPVIETFEPFTGPDGQEKPEPEMAPMQQWLPEAPTAMTALIGPAKSEPAPDKVPVKVYHKSGSDEHGTPQELFDRLDSEFHFDLDVCATAPHEVPNPDVTDSPVEPYTLLHPGNAKCPVYFTQDDNGLAQHWFGRVWMNPPYSKVGAWIQKLLKELLAGRIELAVALTAARPDTAWFQTVASYAAEIRFLKGRLTFEGQPNAAPFPSAVLVFDPTRTVQIVKFWDWQTGTAPVYWKSKEYVFFAQPGKPGIAVKTKASKPFGPLALVK